MIGCQEKIWRSHQCKAFCFALWQWCRWRWKYWTVENSLRFEISLSQKMKENRGPENVLKSIKQITLGPGSIYYSNSPLWEFCQWICTCEQPDVLRPAGMKFQISFGWNVADTSLEFIAQVPNRLLVTCFLIPLLCSTLCFVALAMAKTAHPSAAEIMGPFAIN